MIVVADTSPINYLILLGHIGILERLYGKILIPHAVLDELLSRKAPPSVQTWARNLPTWLEVLSPSTRYSIQIENLDPGETEAIALAQELHADLLLIDEAAGRSEAIKRRIPTIGTLGVLREAHLLQFLNLPFEILRLQALGFRISNQIVNALLQSIPQSTQ